MLMASEAAQMQPCADCINDASGVEPKAAPGGQDGRICGMSDGEIGAGDPAEGSRHGD